MKSRCVMAMAGLLLSATSVMASVAPQGVSNMGNVKGGDVTPAQSIIDRKCTQCHSGKIVEAAIFGNKDMAKIQKEMEKKGAKLDADERDVLGIYWKQLNPLKKSK